MSVSVNFLFSLRKGLHAASSHMMMMAEVLRHDNSLSSPQASQVSSCSILSVHLTSLCHIHIRQGTQGSHSEASVASALAD